MPEYLAPGVYVEEESRGPKPIEGVSTSTAGFLGETERGPTDPTRVTSYAEFRRAFGGVVANRYLAYGVEGFFRNGGQRCYIGRVTGATETASATPGDETRPQPGVLHASASSLRYEGIVAGHTARETVALTNLGDPNAAEGHPDVTVAVGDLAVVDEAGNPIPGDGAFQVALFEPGADIDADDPVAAGAEATIQPGAAATLVVTFAPDDAGQVRGTLSVPYSDDRPNLTVSLDGRAVAPTARELDAAPARVSFSRVVSGHTATRRVSLTNLGDPGDPGDPTTADPTLTIAVDGLQFLDEDDNAIADESEFGVELYAPDSDPEADPPSGAGQTVDVAPGQSATVVVSFTPSDVHSRRATLRVPSTDPDGNPVPDVTVALVGSSREAQPSEVEASRTTVDFGAVFVGHTARETVTLTNLGDSGDPGDPTTADPTLTVPVEELELVDADGTPIPDDGAFAVEVRDADGTVVDAGDVDIEPGVGASITLGLSYTPTDVRAGQATLTVPVGDATVTLSLRSQGVVMEVTAVGPGRWGRRVALTVEDATLSKPDNQLFRLTVQYWRDEAAAAAARRGGGPDPDEEEVYDNLSPVEASSDHYVKRIDDISKFIAVERLAGGRPPSSGRLWLDGDFDAEDPPVGLLDFRGDPDAPAGERTGLTAFTEVDNINIVSIPDEHTYGDIGLTADLVDHCETIGDRFAVLQSPQGPLDEDAERPDSTYAGYYYPRIYVRDPETGGKTLVPPGGHVAGVYARSDTERGVHKAPANEILRGAVELEFDVTRKMQASLNPAGVNCIRSFRGRGIRIWGARTLSSDPEWKYVNVRRLFLYLEESIDENTQWVVFEPNNELLWARVRQTISNFLTTVWRDGALMGSNPDEAFYVKCDRSTMTQADIDAGRLIVEIGVAPTKPAEFVIFRIAQWTASAEGA